MSIASSPPPRRPLNLHTLHGDVLHEVLLLSPNRKSLRRLILTHPAVYYAFKARRRLILRTVFKMEASFSPLDINAVESILVRLQVHNPIDGAALREALWPRFEPLLPASFPSKWATALLACYHSSNLKDDALVFTKRTTAQLLNDALPPTREARTFAWAATRTYVAANLAENALQFQEAFLRRLNPRRPEHSSWAKELVIRYRDIKGPEQALQLQRSNWELYQTTLGPNSDITLDWARSIVHEHQSVGDHQKAVLFHEQVRTSLNPTTAQYVAWSRQQIRMLQRLDQIEKALLVMEEVWRHLQPDSAGYRAWTAQLIAQYEAGGRNDAAIAVCEAAWTAIKTSLDRLPNGRTRKYHAYGAALMLAKTYRRNNRKEDAISLEVISESLRAEQSGLGIGFKAEAGNMKR
jgi:tetratricopeptide (TPR) repeat protein